MKHVSVVIPNYNGRHLLEKHLPAVMEMLQDGDQVIIVDDASSDDSVQWLVHFFHLKEGDVFAFKNKFFRVKLLANKENVRFAESCNRGAAVATHPLLFLLNSDVAPEPDVLEYLVPHFDDEKVFGVGCNEVEEHRDSLTQKVQLVHGGKNKLWFQRGIFMHARADEFGSGNAAWVSGGSGLFDVQKWRALGGFDLAYKPAYWEDIDLSFRARKKGWKTLFEEKAVVHHNHESTNKDAFGQKKMTQMSWRNAEKFVWKNGTFLQKIQFIVWQPYWRVQRWRHES